MTSPLTAPWLILRHIEHEHLGTLASVLEGQKIRYHYLDVFRGERVPSSAENYGGIIVLGGPMGVYEADRYPFLTQEMELIRSAARAGRPVLGICLGAQLIAAALGARVFPGSGPGHGKEIGWYRVELTGQSDPLADPLVATLPASFMAFHWHGDTFDLPSGAVRLFQSAMYANQGFRWGDNVLAIQFHFEVSRTMIADWLADAGCQAEIAAVPGLRAATILEQTAEYAESLERLSKNYFTAVVRQLSSHAAGRATASSLGAK